MRTRLGKKLMSLRKNIIASGAKMLTADEVAAFLNDGQRATPDMIDNKRINKVGKQPMVKR